MSNLFIDGGPPPTDRKVMLATTAYDSPDASYTFSIARSREALHKAGLPTSYLLLQGNCHVDDARNAVVREFLVSECTDLVFLDADVSWEPEHLIELCDYDCDLVGGVYPYRRETGKEGMPVRNKAGCVIPDENGLLEVEGLPTGFMRIRRHVLEALAKDAPHYRKESGESIPLIFERKLEGAQRWGGDINFCAKWLALGGKVYAAAEMRLGHCGKQVIRDSLGSSMRRQAGLTLEHVAKQIKDGTETVDTYGEALKYADNPWGAPHEVLSLAVLLARKAQGPIIETGTGLTTILMAAATDQTVWCIEHEPYFADRLERMAHEAGVFNIKIVEAPIEDRWYDLSDDMEDLPDRFALALVDGPPRVLGDRMRFFDILGDRVSVILCDDANDSGYMEKLEAWAATKGMAVKSDSHRAAVLLPPELQDVA